jgi:nitroreductase
MDVLEAIESRRSIRKYREEPVPQELTRRILEAARLAPSTSNTQSWKFKVVTDAGMKRRLKEAALGQKFVEEAPVVIACCLDLEAFAERGRQTVKLLMRGVRPSLEMAVRFVRQGKGKEFDPERVIINGAINVSIATEHMVLAATSLGLGTCWVRAFDAPAVEELLEVPEGIKVLTLLTLGYPAQSPGARPRKSLEEITF